MQTSDRNAPTPTNIKSTGQGSSVAAVEKDDLSQSQVIKNSYAEDPMANSIDTISKKGLLGDANTLDYGNFFNVIFVPDPASADPGTGDLNQGNTSDKQVFD